MALADALLDALPQTQCRRCGYADCRAYADAIAADSANVNRCPPGGSGGVARLAIIVGCERTHTVIDDFCTGCELCVPVCPVDCISLVNVSGEQTGWRAWTADQAELARRRYDVHRERFQS